MNNDEGALRDYKVKIQNNSVPTRAYCLENG